MPSSVPMLRYRVLGYTATAAACGEQTKVAATGSDERAACGTHVRMAYANGIFRPK